MAADPGSSADTTADVSGWPRARTPVERSSPSELRPSRTLQRRGPAAAKRGRPARSRRQMVSGDDARGDAYTVIRRAALDPRGQDLATRPQGIELTPSRGPHPQLGVASQRDARSRSFLTDAQAEGPINAPTAIRLDPARLQLELCLEARARRAERGDRN